MDQNDIRQIAHFKILLAKVTGTKIDLIKFNTDNAYARQVFAIATATENEELLVIAMQMMQRRGLMSAPVAEEEKKGKEGGKKYTGGLR